MIPCLYATGRQWLREENPPPRITPTEGCVNGPRPYSLRSADTLGKQADVRPPLYRCRGPCHTEPKFHWSRAIRISCFWAAGLPVRENEPARIVAGAGVQLREVPPHPQTNANGKIDIVSGRQAIIQNVYTEPERRRRGLAALLIKRIIDWTRQEGIDSLVLHANDSALSPRPKCDLTASDNRQSGSD